MGWLSIALVDRDKVDEGWSEIFGESAPSWVFAALAAIGLVSLVVRLATPAATALAAGWKSQVAPRVHADRESRLQANKRQSLASVIFERTQAVGRAENWLDERYAELEAQVVIDGQGRRSRGLRWLPSERRSRRIERSLGTALVRTHDARMVLLGDPGAGKSVALRHAAEIVAGRGRRSRDPRQTLPIYVNLRSYAPPGGPSVESLRDFVRETLIGDAPASVATYVTSVFEQDVLDGHWLILFDSFDEIPAVLSSTDADGAVAEHRNVINEFSGQGPCRIVLASRHFRGPALSGWTQLQLLPLTRRRQTDLVRHAQLETVEQEKELLTWLRAVDGPLRDMVANPLFLHLVCEQVGLGGLPATTYEVFDRFITRRLERDEPSVRARHGLGADELRTFAEQAGFVFADRRLGLEPEIAEIAAALGRSEGSVRSLVDGLEHVRLVSTTKNRSCMKFAHRRFQEYFATSAFLRGDGSVSVERLVHDGRWRETAVTIMQTRPIPELHELFVLVVAELRRHIDDMALKPTLSWPPGLRSLLDLVETGLAGRRTDVPLSVRDAVSELLAKEANTLLDIKWAVEVSGCCHEEVRERLLTEAFANGGPWTHTAAFSSALRHGANGAAVRSTIASSFVTMARRGALSGSYHWLDRRLAAQADGPLRRVLRWARWAPRIDAVAAVAVWLLAMSLVDHTWSAGGLALLLALGHLGGYGTIGPLGSTDFGFDSIGVGRFVNATRLGAFLLMSLRAVSAYVVPAAIFLLSGYDDGLLLLAAAAMAEVYWALWWPSLGPIVRRRPDGPVGLYVFAPLAMAWISARGARIKVVGIFGLIYALAGTIVVFALDRNDGVSNATPYIVAVLGATAVLWGVVFRIRDWSWRRRYVAELPEKVSVGQVVIDALGRTQVGQGTWLLRVVRSRDRLELAPGDAELLLDVIALTDRTMSGDDEGDAEEKAAQRAQRVGALVGLLGASEEAIRRPGLSTSEIEELGRWIEEIQQSSLADV